MSKQYLAEHTIDEAHSADIFALATTPTQIITGSSHPDIKIHSTTDFTHEQVLKNAHPSGCHHIAISRDHSTFVSVGFQGDAKIWKFIDGIWKATGEIVEAKKAGELWAVALESEGKFVVGTSYDGRNTVWSIAGEKIAEYETRGGFGLAVDVSPNNNYTATAHPTGNIYVFDSSSTRLLHALPTQAAPARVVKFSPGSSLLAASGDSTFISIYDPKSGEQVAQLRGHEAWVTSLDWSYSGEYIVSGSLDGKVKIWSVEARTCVCTMTDGEGRGIWGVRWIPKGDTSMERGKAERFVTAGNNGGIGVYREASGAS